MTDKKLVLLVEDNELNQDMMTRRLRRAGLEVVYAGGIPYDLVEMRLRDADGDDRHYLRVRASGQ